MGWPGPRRIPLTVKVRPEAPPRYYFQAQRTGVSLSTRIRRMLTYAEHHMPDDYTEEQA